MAANVPNAPAQAQPAPAVAVPPAPAIVGGTFALNPADLPTAGQFVDYSSTEGRKAYQRAIEPLDPKYDGNPKGLQVFIHKIKRKASICGWLTSIMTIPTATHPAGISLLINYGQITMTDMTAFANTYVGQHTKASQDSNNFRIFLDGSLSDDLLMRVVAQAHKYTYNGFEDGPSMFRVILNIVGIETQATVAVINAKLRSLPAKLIELDQNITTFNEFVVTQQLELTSRGKEANDLLYLLFEAYLTSKNERFAEYIRTKEIAVFDNSIGPMEPTELMFLAEEKFKLMVIRGQWTEGTVTGTVHDEHIVALRAEIEQLKSKGGEKKGGKASTTKTNTGKWAWKDIAPKANEPKVKTVGGKTYVHCPNHTTTKWVLAEKHKEGCTLDPNWKFPIEAKNSSTIVTAGENKDKKPDGKTLQYMRALMSCMSEDEITTMMKGEDEDI